MTDCTVCSARDVQPEHFATEKHKINASLKEFASNKEQFVRNLKGIAAVSCSVKTSLGAEVENKNGKIKISAKPDEKVEFKFSLSNESQTDDIHVTDIKLVHSCFNFVLENNPFSGKHKACRLAPRNKLLEDIVVSFNSPNIGQYETPIIFYFQKKVDNVDVILMKEMDHGVPVLWKAYEGPKTDPTKVVVYDVVFVEANQTVHDKIISPYARKGVWAKELIKSSIHRSDDMFSIPKSCKPIFANGLKAPKTATPDEKDLATDIRHVFDKGITKDNYIKFFHNVLWYEETVIRVNIKNYNMSGVTVVKKHHMCGTCYALEVPGLAEKRPSLMLGDLLYIRPSNQNEVMFEASVKEINENLVLIGSFNNKFTNYYSPSALFDVRFFISRTSIERMHFAVHSVKLQHHETKIFPEENKNMPAVKPILNFFNVLVEKNFEQRCAVEHIVAGTSGTAPYLLHGPPGTGKTVTIVEAVLQLVLNNPENRIMVCTDSNMAADHVATMLIKYSHMFPSDFLLRANSKFRMWESLPDCLAKYSNGTSHLNFQHVQIDDFMAYSIVITTLSHAAMFSRLMQSRRLAHHISHLFIDEAAQASEPACLIPVCGMLKEDGSLVLAGDPQQLGPVIISQKAHKIGLGKSLMERLVKDCPLYSDIRKDPNYVVMLRNNFRSNRDILEIPNKLFYKGQLRALADKDELSDIDILGEKQHSHSVVFHGVLSKEQKIGKSPSFFNMMECEMVLKYVKRLVMEHNVPMHEIGIVTPYIRQVYQIKKSLRDVGYDKIEVGTVEAYQGKEKRIIIISTVRANCNLLDHDAKFRLGFLVDDKRFNVAITRAKAKCIIIGNPLCLSKDIKWRMYMQRCRELGTYHGYDAISMENDNYAHGKEIINNLISMLQGIKITDKKTNNKKKSDSSAEVASSVPVAE